MTVIPRFLAKSQRVYKLQTEARSGADQGGEEEGSRGRDPAAGIEYNRFHFRKREFRQRCYCYSVVLRAVVAPISLLCMHQVDEEMRQELAEWKLAVDKDKGGKTKANAKVRPEIQIAHSVRFGHR